MYVKFLKVYNVLNYFSRRKADLRFEVAKAGRCVECDALCLVPGADIKTGARLGSGHIETQKHRDTHLHSS